MSYNGWSNYETWAVSLWIRNEEGTSLDAIESAKERGDDSPVSLTIKESATRRLAEVLKDWVSEELVPDLGATLAAELLRAALSKVDWYEIASHYVEEAE